MIFIKLLPKDGGDPVVVDVHGNSIQGLSFDKGTVKLIPVTGDAIPIEGWNQQELSRVEFTVVYPDASAKIGGFSEITDKDLVMWGNGFVNHSREIQLSNDWRKNAALYVVRNGAIVNKACDHSSQNACNAQ
ncbi:MAG: hypothetical protein QM755_16225 [Luteolibacter sp.]